MNEANPRKGRYDHQSEVEGFITEITSTEIGKTLRKMKNLKATELDILPVWKRERVGKRESRF